MQSFFGIEASRPVQIAAAIAIFLVLLLIFFLVARKLAGARLMMPGSGRSRQPRIGIVDIYDLDKQRQLVLLRRDNVEHLLLIGGLNDVVIETNIVRVAGARSSAQDAGPERLEPVLDQAPRPQVESPARPSIETQLAAQLGTLVRRPAGESDADQELSPVAHVGGPASAHPEPVLRPGAVTVSTAPAVQGFRPDARAPAVPSAPSAPEPVVERREPRPVVAPPAFQSRPTPVPPTPPAPPAPPPPSPPAPEVVRAPDPAPMERDMPAEKQGPDAAILSDMAKQLEAALKRPAMPVPPPPMAPPPRPARDPMEDEGDLPEPGPVHETPVASREEAQEEDDRGELPEAAQPEPVRADEPPRPSSEPFLPAPSPEPAQPAPPSPARAAEAPGPSSKAPDPFSVEDIEAEFARLLGRPLDPGKKG